MSNTSSDKTVVISENPTEVRLANPSDSRSVFNPEINLTKQPKPKPKVKFFNPNDDLSDMEELIREKHLGKLLPAKQPELPDEDKAEFDAFSLDTF